jgi:hypothetical protein
MKKFPIAAIPISNFHSISSSLFFNVDLVSAMKYILLSFLYINAGSEIIISQWGHYF